jgi:1,4-dihydroxy-2-naphthoyl-CoA synthase
MANPIVLYEVKSQIAYITMNRPEKRNALNSELCIELGKTWGRFEQDPDARVAILSGADARLPPPSSESQDTRQTPLRPLRKLDAGDGQRSPPWPRCST